MAHYATPLMRYVSKCIPKQMHLQLLPENVLTERRVSEVVRQRIPGHRTGDGERPKAERCCTLLSFCLIFSLIDSQFFVCVVNLFVTNACSYLQITVIKLVMFL